eukprot:m.227816 g.227816  ORF g.227816 m.227816 type:complete len:774 (+) comp17327_c0_seq1:3-2324(+)
MLLRIVLLTFTAGVVLGAALPSGAANIPRACSTPATSGYPFCDPSLPIDTRIQDLISRLTLEEKPYLMVARESPKGNISRLGIPEYDWGGNCIHGVQSRCGTRCPTSFPNPNALGATFNSSNWLGMGRVIGIELRSLWLQGVGENHGSNLPHIGLDCWSPNIEVVRDPRWGRNMETPSEDPLINGLYGTMYSRGMQQGDDPRYLMGVTTLKHFDANSLEGTWGPYKNITRHTINENISIYDLASTYLYPFAVSVIEGGAAGVMCSYNSINGVPSCANPWLLDDVLRKSWGFDGYVTSDSGAVEDVLENHHYVSNRTEAVAEAIRAGCDVQSASWPKDQPWSTGGWYIDETPSAVKTGLLSEADLDAALARVLRIRFRLGLFDPIDQQPYWHIPPEAVRTPESEALATDMTEQGLVLLQNPSVLPLVAGQRVAVIGPLARDKGVLLGNYLGQVCPGNNTDDFSCVDDILHSIHHINGLDKTTYVQGVSSVTSMSTSGFAAAISAANAAEAVILVIGLDGSVEGEGHDRHSITLPGVQEQLAAELLATGKPVVIVLLNGGAVAIDALVGSKAAIIEAWYPGYYGAGAIGRAIFGQTNKFGKLPITIFNSEYVSQFDMLSFDMTRAPGRTYRYFTGTPLFPFGFGLSYTTFQLDWAGPVPQQLPGSASISVHNMGSRGGDETVMVFFTPLDLPASAPASKIVKQLLTFERVTVAAEQTITINFALTMNQLALFDAQGNRVVFGGRYRLLFTNGQADLSCVIDISKTTVLSLFPKLV